MQNLLRQRIVIIDGAMGTMIQRYKLEEANYRGERFKDWPSDLSDANLATPNSSLSQYSAARS